jgi:hypothetical protein
MRQDNHRDDEHDAPRDPQIQSWFQGLGEPPVAAEPLGARLRMLARIDELRDQRWRFSWVLPRLSPMWATGLAAVLLCSLGLNVWWGNRLLGGDGPSGRPVVLAREAVGPLSTDRFQATMRQPSQLGAIVAARELASTSLSAVGFTPQAESSAFFRMGGVYADALAALRGGATATAAQRLKRLSENLTLVQAPDAVSEHLRLIRDLIQARPDDAKQWTTFLATFESRIEAAYANPAPSPPWILFQAGAWLENMSLAIAADDAAALRQEPALSYFQQAFTQLRLPPGTADLMSQLRTQISATELGAEELQTLDTQIKALQNMLSD